jgi:hypothetical protein
MGSGKHPEHEERRAIRRSLPPPPASSDSVGQETGADAKTVGNTSLTVRCLCCGVTSK